MIVVVAVDDGYGMMFNKRRQSQDEKLREHLLALCSGKRLRMNEYSAKQFATSDTGTAELCVDEAFLDKAGIGEYCFVENGSLKPYLASIEKLLVYKWNRKYPADITLDIRPEEQEFTCTIMEEFVGKSHEKITVEEWRKV